MLRIEYADYEALRAHGEETYPNECCGVLLGKNIAGENNSAAAMKSAAAVNHVQQIVRAGNTRTDSAHNRYNIAPQELVKIQRQELSHMRRDNLFSDELLRSKEFELDLEEARFRR